MSHRALPCWLGGLVLLLAACSDSPPDPAASGRELLIEQLDRAELRLAGTARSPHGRIEREADGSVWLIAELPAAARWQPLAPGRAQRLGLADPELVAWHLDIRLPTDHADTVKVEMSGRELARWDKPLPPQAFSAFFQPGGFVREGLYLAVPSGLDPGALELSVRFRPNAPLLVEHLVSAGTPFAPELLATHATRGSTSRPALFLTPGIALAFPVEIPPQATLRFGLAVADGPWGRRSAPASLRVGFRASIDAPWALEERFVFDPGSEWQDVQVDLAPMTGRSGELVFELVDAGVAPPLHYVADPVLAGAGGSDRSNLLLIVVDGLRADRLVVPPDGQDLTPTLLRLARSGLAFRSARAAAPWTRPSLASIFTGTPPARHGVERERAADVLPRYLPTLAESLRRAGYTTGAFSANLHLDPAFGLHRGFANLYVNHADGSQLNEQALRWLDSRRDAPFFLFVFYMDTHYPLRHRPEYDRSSSIAAEPPLRSQMTSREARERSGTPDPSATQVELLEALYDENVRYADEQIGQLLGGLAARGLLEETLVIVIADHGEAFGEHGDLFHGWNLYDELLRVPLIAAGGPLTSVGQPATAVSLIDLPASLLSLLGVAPDGLTGRDDLFTQPPGTLAESPTYAETRFRGSDAASVVDSRHKLIWNRASGSYELFDLTQDPGEKQNLASTQPERAAELGSLLRGWLDERTRERAAAAPPEATSLPGRETLDQLRALGYFED